MRFDIINAIYKIICQLKMIVIRKLRSNYYESITRQMFEVRDVITVLHKKSVSKCYRLVWSVQSINLRFTSFNKSRIINNCVKCSSLSI